jgi:hypothetical protein
VASWPDLLILAVVVVPMIGARDRPCLERIGHRPGAGRRNWKYGMVVAP